MNKFWPDTIIRFGTPQTEAEAILRLKQIDAAARLAAQRAVVRYQWALKREQDKLTQAALHRLHGIRKETYYGK
jgi:hypothetical protein